MTVLVFWAGKVHRTTSPLRFPAECPREITIATVHFGIKLQFIICVCVRKIPLYNVLFQKIASVLIV